MSADIAVALDAGHPHLFDPAVFDHRERARRTPHRDGYCLAPGRVVPGA
ncbi:hypothetical protein [Methanoculleus sp. UBA303]|nr:hypothetical protein [Methanoculleus sp. UBA303]